MLSHYYYGGSRTPYLDLLASLGAALYWPLQNVTGTEAINGADLTWNGSPTSTDGPGGELPRAVQFTAASNIWGYVDTALARPTTAITVGAWVYFDTLAADLGIVAAANTGFQGHCLRASGTATVTFKVGNAVDTNTIVTTDPDIVVSTWYFLVGVYDKTDVRLYNDGELSVVPGAATYDIGYSSNVCYVGNWDGNSARDHDGRIAGAFIIPTAITSTDVSDLYTAVTG